MTNIHTAVVPDKKDYVNVGDNKAGGDDCEEEIMERKSQE